MTPDLNYIHVMEEIVGKIPLLPDFNTATVSMIADIFDTIVASINNAHYRLRKQSCVQGEKMVTPEDFLAANWNKDKCYFVKGNYRIIAPGKTGIKTFTKEGIFALAHEMPNNKKAIEIRSRIWNLKYGKAVQDNEPNVKEKPEVKVVENPEKARDLQIFSNEKFGNVRIVKIDEEPWFVGKDVAEALGYDNHRDALYRHVEKEDKWDVVIHDALCKG